MKFLKASAIVTEKDEQYTLPVYIVPLTDEFWTTNPRIVLETLLVKYGPEDYFAFIEGKRLPNKSVIIAKYDTSGELLDLLVLADERSQIEYEVTTEEVDSLS